MQDFVFGLFFMLLIGLNIVSRFPLPAQEFKKLLKLLYFEF